MWWYNVEVCPPELAAFLAKLFQYNYNTGIYPAIWKIARLCTVHEKQDKSKLSITAPFGYSRSSAKLLIQSSTFELATNWLADLNQSKSVTTSTPNWRSTQVRHNYAWLDPCSILFTPMATTGQMLSITMRHCCWLNYSWRRITVQEWDRTPGWVMPQPSTYM